MDFSGAVVAVRHTPCAFCGNIDHPTRGHLCGRCGAVGLHRTRFHDLPQCSPQVVQVCAFCGNTDHPTHLHLCGRCGAVGLHKTSFHDSHQVPHQRYQLPPQVIPDMEFPCKFCGRPHRSKDHLCKHCNGLGIHSGRNCPRKNDPVPRQYGGTNFQQQFYRGGRHNRNHQPRFFDLPQDSCGEYYSRNGHHCRDAPSHSDHFDALRRDRSDLLDGHHDDLLRGLRGDRLDGPHDAPSHSDHFDALRGDRLDGPLRSDLLDGHHDDLLRGLRGDRLDGPRDAPSHSDHFDALRGDRLDGPHDAPSRSDHFDGLRGDRLDGPRRSNLFDLRSDLLNDPRDDVSEESHGQPQHYVVPRGQYDPATHGPRRGFL